MVSAEDQLGLMIRGGVEFGLGIFVTGVLNNSVAFKLGLKVGEMRILKPNLTLDMILNIYIPFIIP